jgi:hypothetical protein
MACAGIVAPIVRASPSCMVLLSWLLVHDDVLTPRVMTGVALSLAGVVTVPLHWAQTGQAYGHRPLPCPVPCAPQPVDFCADLPHYR